MNIPNQVKIGAHDIQVEEVTFQNEDVLVGHASYETGKIRINKELFQTMKEATFLHEAMHIMNTTIDHTLLDSLAEQLYQFLKDNKLNFND